MCQKYFHPIVLFSIFFIPLWACQPKQERLLSSAGLEEYFNPQEIEDLEKVLMYFDEQVSLVDSTLIPDLAACYQAFFNTMKEARPGVDYIPLSYPAQYQVFGSFHDNTLATFWTQQIRMRPNDPTHQVLTLVYQPESELINFFSALGEDYVLIQRYMDRFKAVHTISPDMEAEVIKHRSAYNIADVRVRLFLAMHFATLNDHYKRIGNTPIQVENVQ